MPRDSRVFTQSDFKSAKNLYQQEGLDKGLAETLLAEGKTFMLIGNYRKARSVIEQALAQAKKIDDLKLKFPK